MTPRKKKLRVGFDLDGVILYNPARIVRKPVVAFKHFFIPKKEKTFLVPRSPYARIIWHMFHWSSFMVAKGYEEIGDMYRDHIIEPYIVTARFNFLKNDFNKWAQKLNFKENVKGYYINEKNEQPHEFKERMVKKLKLDIFVEDNWDVIQHLHKNTPVRALWMYNIFDRNIDYPYKYSSLKKAINEIRRIADSPKNKHANKK